MVEVGVPDQYAHHLAGGLREEALVRGRIGTRRAAQQQACQRHARHVGVDVERPALVVESVSGDPEPLEREPGR